MIGNDERGIFQKFRSSRILNLNDHNKAVKKKTSLGLPVNTRNNDERQSKKRKHSEMVAEIQEIQMEKPKDKPKLMRTKPEEVKEQDVVRNQYLTEYKIDCPKDFHYENYFSAKREELQEMLLNDPIMSVDELFDLESLKLVFGTSAIKKDEEDIEKIGPEIAARRRKYYDFSETNVRVDDLLSHSPIVKTLFEEDDDDLRDDYLLDKRSKRQFNIEDTHEFVIPAIKEHLHYQGGDPAQRNPSYFDSWQHHPRIYYENPRKKIIEKYQKPNAEKSIGLISPGERNVRDEYKKAQNMKKDNLFGEEYDNFYQVRSKNQHRQNDFYPDKDFYYFEKPQNMDVESAMYRYPSRERITPQESYVRLYNYYGAPDYQTFKIDNYGGDPMRNMSNMGSYANKAPLSSKEEAFKMYPQNSQKNYLVQDQNQQKHLPYYKDQPYFGRTVVGEPREAVLYPNQVNEDKHLRVSQIGPNNYMGHPNSKHYPYMS